ncbi:MAG: ATP synthase F1 subunit delta [Bacteroidia bacterium]|nr:ATP synthase F1 subunit delta [Bacteroidia bacterium]
MVEDRIGYRYANSVFQLAEERNMIPGVKEDMALILDIHTTNREFANFLKTPLISSPAKEKIITTIFEGRLKTQIVEHLVRLITRKGREMYLPHTATAFLQIYDKHFGIVRGKLTSASPLSEDTKVAIKAAIEKETGNTFEMDHEVDPSLIGGFLLKMGDDLFDGSVVTSLRKIKQEFTKNN